VTRLAGHGLRYEGKTPDPLAPWGQRNGPGPARCECGWESEPLPTTAARQRAHREHKEAIRGE
jgi:hypothetical protein